MRTSLAVGVTILSLLGMTAIGAAPAGAITWSVCNRTADPMSGVVAYGRGNTYVSRGWWNLRACGGCARVATDASVTGAFVRGETAGSAFVQSTDLFCIRRRAFTMPGANVSSALCRSRGGEFAQFRMVILQSANHTTNIVGRSPSGRVCID